VELEILLRLILIGVLLALSGFFSGSEVAFFSLDPVARKKQLISKDKNSKRMLWLLHQPRRLIITLLVGNEIVNISTSSISATLSKLVFTEASQLERILISIFIVLPILLIFGEITPKTIAYHTSEGWSTKVATPLYFFAKLIKPIRLIFRKVSDLVVNLLGGKIYSRHKEIKEKDFIMLVEKGNKYGNILDQEGHLIKNVFKFGDKLVKDVMTPKKDIYSIPGNINTSELLHKIRKGTFSRVPVIRPNTKEVLGILHIKDIINIDFEDNDFSVMDFITPPFYVSQNTKCLRLVNEFQKRHIHFAIVLNQSGKIAGLVTMEDLLEQLVGEIIDEKENKIKSFKSGEPA
jgi:putative hemolysin